MSKSRPIIFNAEMVRAIQKGTKTQTRRVIKPEWSRCLDFDELEDIQKAIAQSPYGHPDDLLWVRESIRKKVVGLEWGLYGATYVADFTPVIGEGPRGSRCGRAVCDWEWKRDMLPSIFMPRWASRITLEIIEVRVEQIQQISYEDVIAEGINDLMAFEVTKSNRNWPDAHTAAFANLWDSINAKRGYSWESNPWVWAVTFKRIDDLDG